MDRVRVERVVSAQNSYRILDLPVKMSGSNIVKAASTWDVTPTGTATINTRVNTGRNISFNVASISSGAIDVTVKLLAAGDGGHFRFKATPPAGGGIEAYTKAYAAALPLRATGVDTDILLPPGCGDQIIIRFGGPALTGTHTITNARVQLP
jgi:hypothetical protein